MASYHCSIKPISRGRGQSCTAAASYRAGVCLKDERTGEVHDYTRKQGIEYADVLLPSGVNMDREQLWNAAENAEKRKDARVAREFELALPAELTPEQRRALATDFAQDLVDKYGVAADVAVHEPSRKGDQRNHHAHILITTRQISAQGLGEKTDLEREDKALRSQGKPSGREQIKALRADWAVRCNAALERAGYQERVNHKSLKAQGIKRKPTIHLGPTATAMERRGERSERGDLNRGSVKENQADRAELAVLEQLQAGMSDARSHAHQWREEQARAVAEALRRAELERERQREQEAQERERQRHEREQKLEAERKAREEQCQKELRKKSRGMGMGR